MPARRVAALRGDVLYLDQDTARPDLVILRAHRLEAGSDRAYTRGARPGQAVRTFRLARSLMNIAGAFDVHHRQLTVDYLDT
jgi:hypothetical protein